LRTNLFHPSGLYFPKIFLHISNHLWCFHVELEFLELAFQETCTMTLFWWVSGFIFFWNDELYIILKRRNRQICEHSSFFKYWTTIFLGENSFIIVINCRYNYRLSNLFSCRLIRVHSFFVPKFFFAPTKYRYRWHKKSIAEKRVKSNDIFYYHFYFEIFNMIFRFF